MNPPQRRRSKRLTTTTPETTLRAALESSKPLISPELFKGFDIRKVSSKGKIKPRLLTLSEDLFTLFVSHHKVGKAESLSDRARYRSFKAYAKVVSTVTGMPVQTNHDIHVIDVADILFVQSGFVGSCKLEACKDPELDPSKVISIFHNNGSTMDFLVESSEGRNSVLDAIQIIREVYHVSKMKVGREQQLLRYVWYDTDFDKSGLIEQSEFLQLLGRINIYLKQERAVKIFKSYIKAKQKAGRRIGGQEQKGITFDECQYILGAINLELNGGNEIADVIFDDLFGKEKRIVTAEEFLAKFLHRKQNEKNATIEQVKTLFSELNSMGISGSTYRIGEDGGADKVAIDRAVWKEYLASSRNEIYDPEKQKLDPSSLNRPLPEYWINSSHNTYLKGDQLKSLSSVEMYVLAMQRGCKCLELDCWDDQDSGVPIVYHGYTLTSKIPFGAIISCVKAYVDANPNTLPIILSLENHCSHPFQEIMADILNSTLEDRLYKLPESSGPLPSPLDLVGKVVVKGKRPPENDDDDLTATESTEESALVQDSSVEITSSQSEDSAKSSLGVRDKIREKFSRSESPTKEGAYIPLGDPPLPKIVPRLVSLTLFNGVKHKDFHTSIGLPSTDMHSFSETKMEKLYKDPANVQLLKEYNVDHMSRIYPSGGRIDSSNYNPVVPWSSGCQLVALNFQTDDSVMTINDGRFRENGGCGYVHKPPSVFPADEGLAVQDLVNGIGESFIKCWSCNGTDEYQENLGKKMMIDFKVLYGSCLPKPYGETVGEVIDPYVIIRVHDVEKSESMRRSVVTQSATGNDDMLERTERKTSSVRDNGFCPQWKDSESFSFTVNSDVAMVEIVVMDSDRGFIDDMMCKTAVPVSCLRQGLRSVQFYDQCNSQHGAFGFARIILDVDIKYIV